MKFYCGVFLSLMATVLINGTVSAQTLVTSLNIQQHVSDIAWSPDNELIAVLGSDGIRVYSETLQEQAHFQQDMTRYALSLSWSPDSTKLASIGNGSIFIWRRGHKNEFSLESTLRLEGYLQVLVMWSPDGTKLASQDLPDLEELRHRWSRVHIWNTTSWELERTSPQEYYYGERIFPFALAWSADGSLLAGTGFDRSAGEVAWIVDASIGQQIHVFPAIEQLTSLALNSTGLLATSPGVSLDIRNIHTQQILYDWIEVYEVRDVSWSPDGTKVLFFDHNFGAGIWDFGTGQRIASLPHSSFLAWSPDSTRIAAVGVNSSNDSLALKIWDVSNLPTISGTPTLTPYPTAIVSETPTSHR